MRYIERHVEYLNAVLFLGVEHSPVRTEYTFSTLFAIFPKILVNNIAFISTSPPGAPAGTSCREKVPEALKSSPVFTLYNPIASAQRIEKTRERRALNRLVELFDWLDDREPQPAKEIVSLYEKYQNIAAILDQRAREVEIDRLMTRLKRYSAVSLPSHCLPLTLESYARWR